MKIHKILATILLISLLGCSNGSKRDGDSQVVEGTEASQPSDADFIVDAEDDSLVAEPVSETEEVVSDLGSSEAPMVEEMAAIPSSPEIQEVGAIAEYQVKKGDTLMLIAFNLFGDYRKWKELKSLNGFDGALREGMVVKYYKPAQEFTWRPEGLPYLIKSGDTLGTISKDKYGTTKKWKSIYDNNQPLIRDPNLIFSGFTIYYLAGDRDVASMPE